ncbi:MAG: choice-of-anchor D domain-containing protein [Verrucomicrobiaceae bacterium]|nr:choice-of-anchor D domain-containing protein [Verrucomicrobiaceae bacterium]
MKAFSLTASIVLTACLAFHAQSRADVLAITHQDFSTAAQGTAGLQYGYYTEANSTAGTFSTTGMAVSGADWRGTESYSTPLVGAQWMHPGVDTLAPAVRRYTVGGGGEPSFSGAVRILGRFYSTDSGLTNRFVTVNGTNLFVENNKNGETTFEVSATVSNGSTIDLGVAPGANGFSDSVNLLAWIVPSDTAFATQVVGSAYNSPGDRAACLTLATDGVLGSSDAQTFDTGAGAAFPYQFAGLFYGEGATTGMATRIDSVRVDVTTANDFAEVPRVYLLRHNSDPNTSNPAADDRYARLPIVPVRTAANTAGQPYYTFSLTGLTAAERTGYGFAVVGASANASTPIVFSEISTVATRVANTAVIAPQPFYVAAGGHRYARSILRGDWEQVKSDALSYGANLVQIDDANEQQLMVNLFGGTEILFIGLYKSPADPVTPASYKWTTGATTSTPLGAYQNWLPGQPDSFFAKDDYVQMNYGGAGLWSNMGKEGYPETSNYSGIIELPTAGSGAQNFAIASIPATSNIFDAGLNSPTQGGSLPPSIDVTGLDGSKVTFPQIVGVINSAADVHGPDGAHTAGRSCDLTSVGGISGYLNGNNTPALVGVFLGASQPASAPARLDFSTGALGENFTTLTPALGQVFFIGDGLTSGGVAQQFFIPAGATRLFFGIPDGNNGTLYHGTPLGWGDNSGSVSLRAVVSSSASPTITSAQFPITGGQLEVFGGTGPYTFTLLSGSLPQGITISSSGLVSGTAANGSYTFTLHVVDSLGASSDRTFTVTIENTVSVPSSITDWWPGEGAVGDIIGGYHGSLKNGATYATGKVGRCFSFDGVDDVMELPNSGALNLAGSFTIEAWINPTNIAGQPTIIGKRSADANSVAYQLYLSNGRLAFYSTLAGTLTFDFVDAPITANAWHHVAATLTGGQLLLYVDGALAKTIAWSGARAAVSEPATIGATIDTAHPIASPGAPFPGAIDELCLYSRALTLSEINGIYLAGGKGKAHDDVARDYSTTTNNGPVWSYRWIPSTDVNAAYDPAAANANFLSGPNPTGGSGLNIWGTNPAVSLNTTGVYIGGSYDFTPRQFGMHPGPANELAVTRWKAPHAGTYAVSATFYGADTHPTTTDIHIFHNATQLTGTDKRALASYRGDGVSHTQVITVAANDTVDFLVGPGGNGYSSDSTGLAATVVEVGPEGAPNIQVTQTYGATTYQLGQMFDIGTAQAGSPSYYASYFTITNTGTAPLTGLGDVGPGLGVRVTGVAAADYVLTPISALSTLGAGESVIVYLVFSPSAVGTRSAALHFATNDPDQPDFYINLTGVGITAGTGERVDGFNPNAADGTVLEVTGLFDSSGKYIVTGNFTTIGGQTHNRIARMNADGSIDSAFQAGANDSVFAAVRQNDGKIIIGGTFTSVTGTNGTYTRQHIARLNADGTVDTGWYPVIDGPVYSLAIEAGDTLLVGGAFNHVNGPYNVPKLARLILSDAGSVLLNFTPGYDGYVWKIVLYDGKILVGGSFTTIGGASRPNITRLNLDGTADSTFSTPVLNGAISSEVSAIAVDFWSGKIYIGGFFESVNGYTFGHIARLNPGGTLDTSFVSSTSGAVRDILWQIDGKIIIGGFVDQVWSHSSGWQTWRRVARLDVNGSLDFSFPAQAGAADYGVFALAEQWDNYGLNIIVGGSFSTMGGLPRTNLARVAPPVPDIHVLSTGAIVHTDGGTRDFGTKLVGGGFTPVIFTLQNVGLAHLSGFSGVGGITIDGTNAAAFSLSGAGVTSLATGASTTITVNFTPQGQGAHEAWLHIHSNDPDEDPFDIKLIGSGGVPITDWRQTNFGTSGNSGNAADDADPDGDGISNLMEFATNGSPNSSNAATQSAEPPATGFVNYLYTRNKLAMAELTFTVEWNDTLSSTGWSNAGVTETILSDDGVTQQVRARVPTGGNGHRFVRLTVTRP